MLEESGVGVMCDVKSFHIHCHQQRSSALPPAATFAKHTGRADSQTFLGTLKATLPVPREPVSEPVSFQALLVFAVRFFSVVVSEGETAAGGGRNNAARGQAQQHCGPVRACGILVFTLTLVPCSI